MSHQTRKIEISPITQWKARYVLADHVVYYGLNLLEQWSEELYNEYLARQLNISKTNPQRKEKLDALARQLTLATLCLQS